MDRTGVFVDAGYLFAQGSALIAGKKLPRGEVSLDAPTLVELLRRFVHQVTQLPLLRIYWYDGTSAGPTAQHQSLAYLDGVKVRLGFVNSVGEQKGVDSLIVTDMITLARNGALAEAVLISGDEDLRVGVQQAQEHGTRVHLVGIKPARGSQSNFLLQEADATYEWGESEVTTFLSVRAPVAVTSQAPAQDTPASADDDLLVTVANAVAHGVDVAQLQALLAAAKSTGSVPKDIHAKLLTTSRKRLGRDLDAAERRALKRAFLDACVQRTELLEGAPGKAP